MNADESEKVASVGRRKRTESGGGHSDSDLSDGWNIIDHLDVPSSDGESVEVIGTDEESHDNGRSMVVELPPPAVPVPPPADLISVADERLAAPREEMFDSSFCWFLFFAAGTVLVSNLTFMAAENFFAWDVGFPTESPSFLRDLPTTPKPIQQVPPYRIPWADNEEADVETVDDPKIGNEAEKTRDNFIKSEHKMPAYKTSGDIDINEKSMLSPADSDNILKYLKALSDVAGTPEAKEKLNQALLVLQALQSGLDDLEDGISEHSELRETLGNQRNKITRVFQDIHSGVSRSVEKIANNILNKVQKLEKKFENQWCKLEKKGYEQEFNGIFYDCQDSKRRNDKGKGEKDTKNKNQKNHKRNDHLGIDSFQFEVDKDSTGKAYNIPKSESGEINEYYNLVNKEQKVVLNNRKHKVAERKGPAEAAKQEKEQLNFKNDVELDDANINRVTKGESKRLYKKEQNKSEKDYIYLEENNEKHKHKGFNDEISFIYDKNFKNNNNFKDQGKHILNKKENYAKHEYDSKTNEYKSQIKIDQKKKNDEDSKYGGDKSEKNKRSESSNIDKTKHHQHDGNREYVSSAEKINEKRYKKMYTNDMLNEVNQPYKSYEPAVELVIKYLRETCEKSNREFKSNDYKKIKDGLDKHVRIAKDVFDSLYHKYCKTKPDYIFGEDKFHKNYHKENRKKGTTNDDTFPNNAVVIESPDSFLKTVMNIAVIEAPEEAGEDMGSRDEGVIAAPRQGQQQWVFSYEELSANNKTEASKKGDWFIKAGESRSKARWAHSRGDWWFERATHRRRHPSPPNGRNNWQFLRAWARHRCRQRPHDGWCSFPHQQYFSNENYNFR